MKKVEDAVSCYQNGFNCTQAIFSAYASELHLDRETALKIASGFGGGIGRMGDTCGAVTGAIMVIGLKFGMTTPEDTQSKEKTYDLVQEFIKRFKSRNNSIVCRDLLHYDLSTPDGKKQIKEKQLTNVLCPKFVQDAAEIIEQIIY